MANVNIKNLKKLYGKAEVIHGVNAFLQDGEFVVIVGPSGCGKSTVLRLIAGLETISDGEIAIDGTRVNDLEPKDRGIAMVFQNYALYPHMTVAQNMAYGLKLRKIPKKERQQRVEEAAELLELTALLKRKPRELSGGQRQRVAMGRAIVREPEVFLFDEPLSNLDAKLRQQVRVELKKLHEKLGTTMIYVTHDQVEAMTLADRIIVMNGGHIEQIGTPDEVYHNPASRFVAGFIGSPPMNFLPAVSEQNDALRLENDGKLHCGMGCSAPGECVAGIRPEKIELYDREVANSFPITIDFQEKLGASNLYYATVGEKQIVVNAPENVNITEHSCWAQFPPDQLYYFHSVSGKRL